jgi:hypothetical protein
VVDLKRRSRFYFQDLNHVFPRVCLTSKVVL